MTAPGPTEPEPLAPDFAAVAAEPPGAAREALPEEMLPTSADDAAPAAADPVGREAADRLAGLEGSAIISAIISATLAHGEPRSLDCDA